MMVLCKYILPLFHIRSFGISVRIEKVETTVKVVLSGAGVFL
jgi:hypothetical protein